MVSSTFKKIVIPYWLFLFVLAAVHLAKGLNILTLNWLLLLLGLQGSVVGVWGAEQTWFITALLICYAATPWIAMVTEKYVSYAMICFIIFPVLLLLMKPAAIGTLLTPVCLYAIAYCIGSTTVIIKINGLGAMLAGLVVLLSFGLRFVLRFFFDGTVFYSGIVATYTHYVAALAIFYLFSWFFAEKKPTQIVSLISENSFEIYLYHYMFTVGPISLFCVPTLWGVSCILVFSITLIIAIAAHYTEKLLQARIFAEARYGG